MPVLVLDVYWWVGRSTQTRKPFTLDLSLGHMLQKLPEYHEEKHHLHSRLGHSILTVSFRKVTLGNDLYMPDCDH